MTDTVWVSVSFVNQPKPSNPKYGSIKTQEYGYISVPTERLGLFQPKRRYCIEIEQKGNYTNFIKMAQQGPAAPQQQAPQPRPQGSNRDPQQSMAPRQQVRAQAQQPSSCAAAAPFNTPQDRQIFITGVVGRAMGSGKFEVFDIKELTRVAADAYDQIILGLAGTGQPFTPGLDYRGPDDSGFNDPLPDPNSYGVDQPEEDSIPY